RPTDGPNVAPGGRPVVSIGRSPVATLLCANAAPQAVQRPADADRERPQRGQTIGRVIEQLIIAWLGRAAKRELATAARNLAAASSTTAGEENEPRFRRSGLRWRGGGRRAPRP